MCRQVPEAKGRYIVSHESTASTKQLSDILSARVPQYRFPAGDDTPLERVADTSKVRFNNHICTLVMEKSMLTFCA